MRLVALLAIVGGCGRLAFDPLDDACSPSGHDEDLDGIDDSCDVCPHIVDVAQADVDGDRVGDACDPEPSVARQSLAVFDPFVTLDPAWTLASNSAPVSVVDDELVLSGTGTLNALSRLFTPGEDRFELAVTTEPVAGPERNLLTLNAGAPGVGAFFCEFFDPGDGTVFKYTYTYGDGTFTSPDVMMMTNRFAGGAGVMRFDFDPTDVACAATWGGETLATSGARPVGIEPNNVRIFSENLEARIAYFIHIRSE